MVGNYSPYFFPYRLLKDGNKYLQDPSLQFLGEISGTFDLHLICSARRGLEPRRASFLLARDLHFYILYNLSKNWQIRKSRK